MAENPNTKTECQSSQLPSVDSLSYEEARNQLQELVAGLERGDVPLQHTLELWQRGQELLTHCRSILDTAIEKTSSISVSNSVDQTGDTPK